MAKKHLLILAAGALALTACTSEDVVDDVATSRNLIQFENVVNKLSRAEDLETKTFKKFNVYGFYTMPGDDYVANKVFSNEAVTKQDNGSWVYTSEDRYWVPNAKYYFYAYSCGNTSKLDDKFGSFSLNMNNDYPEGTPDEDKLTAKDRCLIITDYICDNDHQHDLVFATNTGTDFGGIVGQTTGNKTVPFEFNHILSKVKARFSTQFNKDYKVEIKNVTIQNIRNTGDYDPENGWLDVTRKAGTPFVVLQAEPISVKNEKDSEGNQVTVDSGEAYVIPCKYDQDPTAGATVYINFEIEVYFGNSLVLSKILTGTFTPDWTAGYSYTYNVEISGSTTQMDVITFTTGTNALGDFVEWKGDDGKNPSIKIDGVNETQPEPEP